MYPKDKIRSFISSTFKVDKDFLIRKDVLNELENTSFHSGNYSFKRGNQTITLRNLSSDFNVYKQVFIDHEYKFALDLFDNFYRRRPKTLLDIGANIGLTSLYFAEHVPRLQVIAVEAEANNYSQLKANTNVNPNIQPLHLAVWNTNGTLKINNSFRDGRSWSFQVNSKTGFQSVEAITLNQLTLKYNLKTLDILKIDIEGAEKEVILQDSTVEDVLRNTCIVCVEIHDVIVSRIEITEKLIGLGFKIFAKGETLFAVNTNVKT